MTKQLVTVSDTWHWIWLATPSDGHNFVVKQDCVPFEEKQLDNASSHF